MCLYVCNYVLVCVSVYKFVYVSVNVRLSQCECVHRCL